MIEVYIIFFLLTWPISGSTIVGPFPRRDLEGEPGASAEVAVPRLEPKFLEAPRRLKGRFSLALESDDGGISGSLWERKGLGEGGGGGWEGERERATKPTYNQVLLLHICKKGAHLMEKKGSPDQGQGCGNEETDQVSEGNTSQWWNFRLS